MKRLKTLLMATICTAALLAGATTSASAAPIESPLADRLDQAGSQIEILIPHMLFDSDGGVTSFDAGSALKDGVEYDLVEDVTVGLTAGGASVEGIPSEMKSAVSEKIANVDAAFLAAGCQGWSGQSGTWPFINYYHDSCSVNIALAVIAGTISFNSGVGLLLPKWGQAAVAVLNAMIGMGAAFIAGCNASGNGIIIYTTPFGGWCGSQ